MTQRLSAAGLRRLAVAGLLIVGAFLRLYQLDQYPLGVHQDELSNIYDGYSLAETGADRFGDRYPAAVRAFGERDYRPALYAWLAAIPQRFTGFSVVAGRLPAAILGIASLVLIYLFGRSMAGEGFGTFALLFAALSPLHIQLSRVAHEGAILPGFFLILILYLWHRSALTGFNVAGVIAVGLATGFSTNAYQATRLTGLLLALTIGLDILTHAQKRWRSLSAFGAAAIVGALPQIFVFATQPQRFLARAQVLSVPANDPIHFALTVAHNYWLNLEPHYLFMPPMLRGLTVARLLPPEILFFYAGLIGLGLLSVRSQSRARVYVYLAMAIALTPAALTTGNPSTMRASGIAVLTPIFSAAGLLVLARLVRNSSLRRKVYYPLAIGSIVLAFTVVAYRYARSPYFRELSFQKIAVDMAQKAGALQTGYDAILIGQYVSIPYIYLAAFAPIPPREFQRMPKRLYSTGMDTFTRLGKYYFVAESVMPKAVAALRQRPGRFLFIAPTGLAGLTTVDSVFFLNQKLYFQTF
jgi:4-amino-4-deoxy-L-arabinose transferase-like glycosyltransferase